MHKVPYVYLMLLYINICTYLKFIRLINRVDFLLDWQKEINPEYSLEGLMLKLKLQYFGHLMKRADSLEKTLLLGKTEGKRRRKWQRMRWLDSIMDTVDMNLSKLQEIVKDREAWHAAAHGFTNSWTWLSDWTTTHSHRHT